MGSGSGSGSDAASTSPWAMKRLLTPFNCGFATCRVFLNHQDLGSEKIDHLAGVRVMAAPGAK